MSDRLHRMLTAGSVAVLGASDRPGSFGERMLLEVGRSPCAPRVHPVNPRGSVGGRPCARTLDELDHPVDLVLAGVPDNALLDVVTSAQARADGGVVVFGSAVGLGPALRDAASDMPLCGAGCMGFLNPAHGLRAIGYVERDPIHAGPVALVTHSGSVFSAMLRTRRSLGFSLVVSSGQELVTTAGDFIHAALDNPQTRVVALVLETMRDPRTFRAALARAAAADVAVVALTVGRSSGGRAMVAAHSGALAGDDGMWEAVFDHHGVHRVGDLAELLDTVELLAGARRPRHRGRAGRLGSVHDSGAERALVVDVAADVGVEFAVLEARTLDRLRDVLDPGLIATNPLDVWGTGAETHGLFLASMVAMAQDDDVDVVALAVDLVPEFDGDDSYPRAAADLVGVTDKPVVVLSNIADSVDPDAARALRAAGIPVLEGTRSGLVALRHFLSRGDTVVPALDPSASPPGIDMVRVDRWSSALAAGNVDGFALLEDYGITVVRPVRVRSLEEISAVALGWPVVLKSEQPGLQHRSDVGGVVLDLRSDDELVRAYIEMSGRLGPEASVGPMVPAGVELSLGMVTDPLVGPLLVLGAGGVLVELLADRVVALPHVGARQAETLLDRLSVGRLLDGFRGGAPVDRAAVIRAVVGMSELALELGHLVAAVEINPLVCTPTGATAVDVLVVPELGPPSGR